MPPTAPPIAPPGPDFEVSLPAFTKSGVLVMAKVVVLLTVVVVVVDVVVVAVVAVVAVVVVLLHAMVVQTRPIVGAGVDSSFAPGFRTHSAVVLLLDG